MKIRYFSFKVCITGYILPTRAKHRCTQECAGASISPVSSISHLRVRIPQGSRGPDWTAGPGPSRVRGTLPGIRTAWAGGEPCRGAGNPAGHHNSPGGTEPCRASELPGKDGTLPAPEQPELEENPAGHQNCPGWRRTLPGCREPCWGAGNPAGYHNTPGWTEPCRHHNSPGAENPAGTRTPRDGRTLPASEHPGLDRTLPTPEQPRPPHLLAPLLSPDPCPSSPAARRCRSPSLPPPPALLAFTPASQPERHFQSPFPTQLRH